MRSSPKTGITRLLDFAGPQRPLIILAVIISAVSAILSLLPFVCIYLVVRQVLLSLPVLTAFDQQMILRYGLYAVLFAASGFLCYFIALLCSHYAAFCTASAMRKQVMRHLVTLPLGFFQGTTSGRLRKIIDENTAQTETFLAHQIPDLAGAFVAPFAVLALLLMFDWRLGLASLIPLVFGFIMMGRMMQDSSKGFLKQYQDSLEDMNKEAVEYVRGISVVKVFGQTVHSFKSFYKAIMTYKEFVTAYTLSWQKPMTLFNVIVNGAFFFLLPLGVLLSLHAGDYRQIVLSLIFYCIITPSFSGLLMKVMFMSSYKMVAEESVRRIDELLSYKPLAEPKMPLRMRDASIVFQHVGFHYPDTQKPALSNISFTVKPGQRVALVGPSGGGKTTVGSLIPRFWDVDAGSVLVGGVDVRNLDLKELMQQLSFVFQDAKLIKASVMHNIRLGRPEATEAEVRKAAHAAQCDDIIAKLSKGLDTVIGEKGVYLSGGEQQRVVLARAILKDAPIIILDEATAFADPENEYLIQKALAKLTKDKTVLMIAHRLPTVRTADEILVLDEGSIVERGKHEQLLENKGLYQKLWEEYQRSIAWDFGKKL